MLYIEKSQEPAELTQAKRDGLMHYRDLSGKPKMAVQQAILREQGELCAWQELSLHLVVCCVKPISILNNVLIGFRQLNEK